MNNSISERFTLPDLLKGIAVILMVQVHITELFLEESFFSSQAGKISLFLGGVPAAPLFMTVMGFFIALVQKPLSANLTRAMKLILLGFLLNTGLNLHLFGNILFQGWNIDPYPYLFGVDILFLAGISLMIVGLLLKFFPGNAMPFAVLALIIPALSTKIPVYNGDSLLIRYTLAYLHSYDWWSYFPLIPWLAYPLIGSAAGIWFTRYQTEINKHFNKPLFIIIPLIVVISLWPFGFRISTDLLSFYHHGIRFFVWAIMLLLLLIVIVYFFDKAVSGRNFLKRYLLWTGRNVTAFYVVQWLIIGNLATILYKSQSPLLFPVWLAIVISLTSLIVFAWEKVQRKGIRRKLM